MPRATEQKALLGKIRLESILKVETGLHIGGGGENLDIGGLDSPVIRDPLTRYPYLPGSSIKGKLRAILERFLPDKPLNRHGGSNIYRYESDDLVDGVSEVQENHYVRFEGARTCQISRLFGSTGNQCWMLPTVALAEGLIEEKGLRENKVDKKPIYGEEHVSVSGRNSPARLIVRDCHLKDESATRLQKIDTGLYMTEWKFENSIDRITARANPRQPERVPRGAEFHLEMVYTVENAEQAAEDIQNIAIALAILEDDALGGHGSRGYGKVKFENFRFYYRGVEQYRQITSGAADFSQPFLEKIDDEKIDIAVLLQNFSQLTGAIKQRLLPGSESAQ